MFTIYKITNIKNNKIYIGQTSRSIQERFNEHCLCALIYNYNLHLSKAIRKWGKDNFKIEVIEENIQTYELANDREKYYISLYDTLNRKVGYNSTPGGEGGNTYISKTEDEMNIIRKKISKKLSGENNGKHTVIYMKDTNTNEEIRFGSFSLCDKYLRDNGYIFYGRIYADSAKKNSEYGIQKRLFGKYIFRFENETYHKWTDYKTTSGEFPYKMINENTGEIFVGICKNECLEHFGFSGRCDKCIMEKKGYTMKKLEKYEYKKSLG